MWGLRRSKIHLIGIPDTEEKEWVEESLKSVMAENFSEWVQDTSLQIQETWWNPSGINKKNSNPRQTKNVWIKQNILKEDNKQDGYLTLKKATVSLSADFSTGKSGSQKSVESLTINMLKESTRQPQILHPAKISFNKKRNTLCFCLDERHFYPNKTSTVTKPESYSLLQTNVTWKQPDLYGKMNINVFLHISFIINWLLTQLCCASSTDKKTQESSTIYSIDSIGSSCYTLIATLCPVLEILTAETVSSSRLNSYNQFSPKNTWYFFSMV